MDKKIEEAFATATKILFGRQLAPIGKYSAWLRRRIPAMQGAKSSLGKGECYLPDYSFFAYIPKGKIASGQEFEAAGKMRMEGVSEATTLSQIENEMKKFVYFVPDYSEGSNVNVAKSTGYFNCINLEDGFDIFDCKNCANTFSIMGSEAVFGSYRVLSSRFSLHCYNCVNLNRCFEMDYAKNCNDCMFCHNVEGLENCMFCFNVKGKRYAVANVEIGKEEYMGIKQAVLAQLVPLLEKEGGLSLDVYNALCGGK